VGRAREWRYVESGELAEEGEAALAFICRGGRIERAAIHPDLDTAGLNEADEIARR
jgi:hypothetical protein